MSFRDIQPQWMFPAFTEKYNIFNMYFKGAQTNALSSPLLRRFQQPVNLTVA